MSTSIGKHPLPLLPFSVKQLLPQAKILRGDDLRIASCCGDWRDCRPGDLFVAMDGSSEDGHEFVTQASERGAVGVVTERLLAIDLPQFIVADSRIAYGTLCQALAGSPSQRIRTVGVAGTNGKTVISQLTQSIFQAAGLLSAAATSMEDDQDRWGLPATNATANAPTLANWLATAALDECTHAVVELSSTALAQHVLAGTAIDVAVFGNIRRDQLHLHSTDESYRAIQSRLIQYLKPEGVAILNADDPNCCHLLNELNTPALTFGIHQSAEISAKLMDRHASEQMFLLSAGNDSAIVRTPMIGKHHVYNCLAAAAVGVVNGIDLATIVRGLEAVGQIPGRLERVCCGQPFEVWIDRSRRPQALQSAVHAVQQLTNGRVWVVATVSEELGTDELARMGKILECSADVVVLTQDSYPAKLDYRAGHQVLDGCTDPERMVLVPNRFRAIEWALQNAAESDSVLIAGCGETPIRMQPSPCDWLVTDRDVCEAWFVGQRPSQHSVGDDDDEPPVYRLDDYR